MATAEQLIIPDWPAPKQIRACVSTRFGGVSEAPYQGLNLGAHVGDLPESVQANRAELQRLAGFSGEVQWLNQVHSNIALELPSCAQDRTADASYTTQPNTVCAVLTADCLPAIFTDAKGTQVAAAHAGWRGLCDGVLEATLETFPNPAEVLVWLGPAIGPEAFEVGAEVCEAFMVADTQAEQAFKPSSNADKWLGNLYLLAQQRLAALGCTQVYGGDFCTFSDQERFYSYRRDGVTGRMATLIWMEK
ncbi:Laccase domain protein YfiH [Marinomonas aquimarina]|uniref:Purine nucleoside phosphorylase n=1 Tax=Marinomonas aquimarina TaxID=295068 RepID=A0A1A8T235_9GAMM|nr:peptidoglycan editing factor PgeF [Marinomonas aquimarina]SBS24685.1 Laccase domain protein YfiH [Marinomonas aquimarina]